LSSCGVVLSVTQGTGSRGAAAGQPYRVALVQGGEGKSEWQQRVLIRQPAFDVANPIEGEAVCWSVEMDARTFNGWAELTAQFVAVADDRSLAAAF